MTDCNKEYKPPMPSRAYYAQWSDKFKTMAVGDSVVVNRLAAAGLRLAGYRATGRGGSTRQKKITPDSFRVWRVR